MVIAVDFDGTIVEHRYPRIGEEIPFAIDTLKLLQQEKHRLILWSVREGALLDEAVEWCKARGLEFYAINKDYPEEQKDHQGFSRKLKADFLLSYYLLELKEVLCIIIADIFNHLIYTLYFRSRDFTIFHITSHQVT